MVEEPLTHAGKSEFDESAAWFGEETSSAVSRPRIVDLPSCLDYVATRHKFEEWVSFL